VDSRRSSSPPTDARTSARMASQRNRDTIPELMLRTELRSRGLGYRINARLPNIPRRTCDVAFVGARVAVFIDGCFWHSCPLHAVPPKQNAAWWSEKLERNIRRDRDTERRLEENDWRVLRFWEHEDMALAADVVESVVRFRRSRAKTR
jgi:DNA mismatch endonuclease (patch repair protein)